MRRIPNVRQRSERGIYIVLFVLMAFGIVALLALALGMGFVAASKSRMQHIANAGALAAVKEYIDQGNEEPIPPESERQLRALNRLNEVLQANRIAGIGGSLGDVKLYPEEGDGGVLEFGGWYPEDPDETGSRNPCNFNGVESYPCFCTAEGSPHSRKCHASESEPQINAVRLHLRNQPTNPLIVPFARILGSDRFTVTQKASASLVQRCTAYVFDVSPSAAMESHPLSYPVGSRPVDRQDPSDWKLVDGTDWPEDIPPPAECHPPVPPGPPPLVPSRVTCPVDSALFAFQLPNPTSAPGVGIASPASEVAPAQHVYPINGPSWCDPGIGPCGAAGGYSLLSIYRLFWCGITCRFNEPPRHRPIGSAALADRSLHFKQDYRDMMTPYGRMLVDALIDPEPLTSFLGAFNAGLRISKRQRSPADSAMMIAFAGAIRDRFPAAGTSKNIDLLTQLTQVWNRGMIDEFIPNSSGSGTVPVMSTSPGRSEIHPNFIDRGWFPVFHGGRAATESHLVLAIEAAIDALRAGCPASSKKTLIFASDGVPTCSRSLSGAIEDDCPSTRQWSTYTEAENQLLDPTTGLVKKMTDARIAFTPILNGAGVQPNIRNIRRPHPQTGFLTFAEAQGQGLGENFFESTPVGAGSDEEAFKRFGLPGVLFRRPNRVMGLLAMATGGVYCPLANPCVRGGGVDDCPNCPVGESCYEDDGDPDTADPLREDCARVEGEAQTCALVNASKLEQAALCVEEALGKNPYIMVEEY